MKKFTLLMVALLVAAMSFAQVQIASKTASSKPDKKFAFATKANASATPTAVRSTRENTTIFSEGFNFTGTTLENGWTSNDADGDGNDWFVYTNQAVGSTVSHSGTAAVASASWSSNSGALHPNNWLISPAIDLTSQTGTIKVSYFIKGQDASWYGEHYKVCASTTTTDIANFTTLFEETIPQSGWNERTVDLSAYAGQTIYLAFVHYNITDMFYIVLDDVTVYADQSTDAAISSITAPTHGDYTTCALTNAEQIKINILNNGGAAISNFEVSYTINGGTPVTETVTASVNPAATYEYTFTQTADLSTVGTYTIAASINLAGDEIADNNTANMTITNGDAKITIHAFTDNGGSQTWTVTNTLNSTVVAERTAGWQWNIEVNDYVCVDANQCYNIVVSDEDGMIDGAAYLEILYNGTQVAGSTTPDSFTGPTLTAERIGSGCSSDPEIVTEDTEFEFAGLMGEATNAQEAAIRAFNLTAEIIATTAAPFEVSADNTTFAATATLTANGGTLYIRYNPTEAGTQTGSVVLSSTGADNVTIALAGTAIDCSTAHPAPFSETFAANSVTLACWTIINANNDDKTFRFMYTDDTETDLIAAYPYSSNNAANDWLISPKLSIGENQRVRFQVANNGYEEKYKVWAITGTPSNYESATLLLDETAVSEDAEFPTMEYVTIDLSSYSGQEIYIGIQCVSDADMYYFLVDNFELSFNPTNAEIALTSVTPANNSNVHTGGAFYICGTVTNNGTVLTSYTVSYTVDGGEAVSYNVTEINVANEATHNFTHATPITIDADGAHTIVVTVSNPNGTADNAEDNSMTITINAITCGTISEFPWTEDFENGIPTCWTNIDADGDGHNWYFTADLIANWDQSQVEEITYFTHGGNGSVISESYINYDPFGALNANNYLVTPQIALPSDGAYALTFYTANIYGYEENVSVMISDDAFSFTTTLLPEETINVDLDGGEWAERTVSLADYAGQNVYIAIVHTGYDGVGLLIDDVTIAATTAVEENIAEAIAVYPNPANSVITIANAEGQDITIVNTLGQVVSEINNAAANQTIDISNLANGTYFVKVNAEVVKINVVK